MDGDIIVGNNCAAYGGGLGDLFNHRYAKTEAY